MPGSSSNSKLASTFSDQLTDNVSLSLRVSTVYYVDTTDSIHLKRSPLSLHDSPFSAEQEDLHHHGCMYACLTYTCWCPPGFMVNLLPVLYCPKGLSHLFLELFTDDS